MKQTIGVDLEVFLTAFDQTDALLVVMDAAGRIRHFNPACERLSGYASAEALGRCPWAFLLPPEEAGAVRERVFEALLQDPNTSCIRHTHAWRDQEGNRHLIDWSITALRDGVACTHLVGVGIDLTARRDHEETLRQQAAMIDQIHDAVIATDLDGMVTFWSRGAERIFGYAADERLGRSIADVYPDDQQRFLVDGVIAPLKAKGMHTTEVVMQRKNGERFHGHLALSMRHDASGKPIGMVGYTMDITEQKRAGAALIQSEAHLRHVMAVNPAVLYTCETKGDFAATFVSPNMQDIFGYTPEQCLAEPGFWASNIHPDDAPRVFAELPALFAQDRHAHEYRFRMPDGSFRWVRDELRLIRDAAGAPAEIVGCWHDISARKAAEDALHTQNQIVQAVFNATPVLIAYLDTDLTFVAVNHAYAAVDGKAPADFVGRYFFDLYPNAEHEGMFRRALATGKPHVAHARPFERETPATSGAARWDWTLTPIMHREGRVEALVLSLTDVTQRMQALENAERSEQLLRQLTETLEARVKERTQEVQREYARYQALLNSTRDGVLAIDDRMRIRVANPAYCDIIGYRETELLQMRISDIEAIEDPQAITDRLRRIFAQGYERFDSRHRRKDGRVIDVEISLNVVCLDEEPLCYAIVRDITLRKQTELALTQARDEAQRANRAKSEFLARMSHELRTPMNAVLGFAQILETDGLAPDHLEYVREIHQAGHHLLELINELLDLSRIETGKLSVKIEAISLRAIVSQALRITEATRDARQIALLHTCEHEFRVMADATRLCQILVNLLSNAAKYNHANGRVAIACQAHGGHWLRLEVSDTGPGIAPEKQHLLFRPFERLGAEHSPIEGAGIGLALSKQLAELMGARIGVESAPGQGTTFWIDLPLASDQPTRGVDPPKVEPQPSPHARPKRTVLYVEDNPANLKLVQVLLRRQPDMNLISATSGEYGLELARRYRPDAILLDIHLPGMDGYALLQTLQTEAETHAIPVLALTADAMPLDIERGLQAGFRRYLTKPVVPDSLLEAIREVLHD